MSPRLKVQPSAEKRISSIMVRLQNWNGNFMERSFFDIRNRAPVINIIAIHMNIMIFMLPKKELTYPRDAMLYEMAVFGLTRFSKYIFVDLRPFTTLNYVRPVSIGFM